MRFTKSRVAFLAPLAMLLVPLAAFGQEARQKPGKKLQEFQRRMSLTPEQTGQIRPILRDQAAKVREIRAKFQSDRSRRGRRNLQPELRRVRQDARQRIEPLLTPDQKADWAKLRAERRERRRQ